jgi:hypothetical protein
MTFLEALTFRGVQYRRNVSRRNEVNLCCPFCDDTRFRLGLNYFKSVAHCFNCGWKSRKATRLILLQFHIDALSISDSAMDMVEEAEERPLELPEDFTLLSTADPEDGPLWTARKYLLQRGISPKVIKEHYFGGCLSGKFGYRIIIPVVFKEELKGIVGRDWTGCREPKYLNSAGERSMYNLGLEGEGPLFLSEGCFKAVAIEQALRGFKVGSSALLGHSITDLQIEQIRESGHRRMVIFSDADRVGVEGAINVANRLADENFDVRFVHPLPLADADDMTPEDIRTASTSAKPWTRSLSQRVRLEVAALC